MSVLNVTTGVVSVITPEVVFTTLALPVVFRFRSGVEVLICPFFPISPLLLLRVNFVVPVTIPLF